MNEVSVRSVAGSPSANAGRAAKSPAAETPCFLMSMVLAELDWSMPPFVHAAQLSALRWNLHNLIRLKKNISRFTLQ